VNCDAIAKPELVFVDNCSTVSSPIFTENINRTDSSYSIVRKWLVSDTCVSEFTQIVKWTIVNSAVSVVLFVMMGTPTDLNNLLPTVLLTELGRCKQCSTGQYV
jgi:hypothetical protein